MSDILACLAVPADSGDFVSSPCAPQRAELIAVFRPQGLSRTLGPTVLGAVAERIWRQWPIRPDPDRWGAHSMVDDRRYDDATPNQGRSEEILRALVELSADPWKERPETLEFDTGFARYADRGSAAFRSSPAESDPTKATPHDLAENEIPRDIPGQERQEWRDHQDNERKSHLYNYQLRLVQEPTSL